jgi:hypothetical protein
MSERKERFVTHSKVDLLMCCVGEFQQHIPLFLVRTCKNQQKCLLEMLHNTTKLRKKSVFYAEIFHIKIPK